MKMQSPKSITKLEKLIKICCLYFHDQNRNKNPQTLGDIFQSNISSIVRPKVYNSQQLVQFKIITEMFYALNTFVDFSIICRAPLKLIPSIFGGCMTTMSPPTAEQNSMRLRNN